MKRKEFQAVMGYNYNIEDVAVYVNPRVIEWVEAHLFGQREFDIEIALIDIKRVLYTVPIDEFYMRYAHEYIVTAEGIPCTL